jgi:selenium-binding protein 1
MSTPRFVACAARLLAAVAILVLLFPVTPRADETCMSPYMPKITGQEEFIYVWTLGAENLGDGSDKVATVDVRPGSKTYGKVINTASVGGRNEAHHGGLTDDRRHLWLGGLDTSKIFVFDVDTDP